MVRRVAGVVIFASLLSSTLFVPAPAVAAIQANSVVVQHLKLPGGKTATVSAGGLVRIESKDHKTVELRVLRRPSKFYDVAASAPPDLGRLTAMLSTPRYSTAYVPGRVIVVFRNGVTATRDIVDRIPGATTSFTTDLATNTAFAKLGVAHAERLFRRYPHSMLETMHAMYQSRSGAPQLDFANAYRLRVAGASVLHAIASLAKLSDVAYIGPDWRVSTMHTTPIPLHESPRQAFIPETTGPKSSLPANYALNSSGQSMLNASSVDVAAGYDEIEKATGQLPGQGETITNVSIGDLDDPSAGGSNYSDPCNYYVGYYGPTTTIIGGQRYLDMPSMPLIPAYTADDSGNLDPTGEVCGTDPYLDEIGLDFSVMAPLPNTLQRSGETGSGLTDLLGIAPGANYRLIVPGTDQPAITDIDGAYLGAALQTPRTDILTSSIGFGLDVDGYPSRYLEDDPLTRAIIGAIVTSDDVVVCLSAGDGIRDSYTPTAIGPNGGSAPTDVISNGGTPTTLADISDSSVPSRDFDSGAIDVGGSTLDDIFSIDPEFATSPAAIAQHAYPETRWTGFTDFSSGYGTRVNVSAPADNILAFSHTQGGSFDAVSVGLNGGTSASAPETAAVAAVVRQLARYTGHPLTATAVRSFLEQTAIPIPNVAQADTSVYVGPQVDLRNAVETLLARNGHSGSPGVPRVAIEQRRAVGDFDGAFESNTNPLDIHLRNGGSDLYQLSWITIAPDWEWLPKNATFKLFVTGKPSSILAQTRWARLLPAGILSAAGLPMVSTSLRKVDLVYEALVGNRVALRAPVKLQFGPADATIDGALAPKVPAVVTGAKIPVTYDLSQVRTLSSPVLIVSEPGRVNPATGGIFHQRLLLPLPKTRGEIDVPVSSLPGGGIYGIGVGFAATGGLASDFAYVRVQPSTSDVRPAAPLLSADGLTLGHFLEIPFDTSFQVHWDVSSVPGATGATLEFSAPGPGAYGVFNPLNNPNGTIPDDNGVDLGSVYSMSVSGASGTVTLNGSTIGIIPAFHHDVRVIPVSYGKVVGEGSDFSTIVMDGVASSDGGVIANGFGINAQGFDGFVTSTLPNPSGPPSSSLQSFDQITNLVGQTQAAPPSSLFFNSGWGVYGNDIGFIDEGSLTTGQVQYVTFNPSTNLTPTATNFPYSQPTGITEAAADPVNDTGAFLVFDYLSPTPWSMMPGNVSTGTYGSSVDITTPLASLGPSLAYLGIAENTTTNTAMLVAGANANPCQAPSIVLVDLATGTLSQFSGSGLGLPMGVAVDSTTNEAVVPTSCDGGVTFYNLATKTGQEVTLPGASEGFFVAADWINHKFIVTQPLPPNYTQDNNALSQLLVYDENGNLLETKEQINLFGPFAIQLNNVQLNPSRSSGYIVGPRTVELQPFNY